MTNLSGPLLDLILFHKEMISRFLDEYLDPDQGVFKGLELLTKLDFSYLLFVYCLHLNVSCKPLVSCMEGFFLNKN